MAAVTDPLASVEEYIAVQGEVADKGVLLRQLKACSRLYERETKQFFTKDAAAVARIWVAKYSDYLDVWGTRDGCPGIASTVGLSIKEDTDDDGSFADETAWAATDYEMLPRDALLGPELKPFDRISIPPWSTKSFRPGGRYEVTAIYGRPEVPAAATEDVIEMCAIWRNASPRSTGRINELDEVVTASPLMIGMVSRFKNLYRGKVTF